MFRTSRDAVRLCAGVPLGDGRRRLLSCLASRTTWSVTEHLHELPACAGARQPLVWAASGFESRHGLSLSLMDSAGTSKAKRFGSTPNGSATSGSASGQGILFLNQATWVRIPHSTQLCLCPRIGRRRYERWPWFGFDSPQRLHGSDTLRFGPMARTSLFESEGRGSIPRTGTTPRCLGRLALLQGAEERSIRSRGTSTDSES